MKDGPIAIFLLIDAMGWEYVKSAGIIDKYSDLTGNEVRTVLGYSSAAVPTILTGKCPDEHGRWNLLRYSPSTSPFAWTRFLKCIPETFLANRYAHKLITIVSKRLAQADGYFSTFELPVRQLKLFDVCETRNIYKPGGISECKSVFDHFVENKVPYRAYSYHDGDDETLLNRAQTDIRDGTEAVYFLYLAGYDAYLHDNCHDVPRVCARLEWYFQRLYQLVHSARQRATDVRFFVFSDHGMTPVQIKYDLIGGLRNAGIGPEGNYLAVFDSTMARFWFSDEQMRDKVSSFLRECIAGRILTDEELKHLRVYFPDRRYGELIFLMNPGVLIYPSFFGSYAPAGMHGYHPDDPHSSGAFLSNVREYAPSENRNIFSIIVREALYAARAGQNSTSAQESL